MAQLDHNRETLSHLETDFRQKADRMPRLAWIADGEGSIYWYNKRWYDYTGTSMDDMHGWGWQSVHHPDHVERVVKRLKSSFAAGTPWEDLFPLRGRDGTYRWFLSEAQPLRDEYGQVRFWFGTNLDVTDQMGELDEDEPLAADWAAEGLLGAFQAVPGAMLQETADPDALSAPPKDSVPRRQRILVLEDEPMTALDLEMRLTDAGMDVIGPCMTIGGAERELEAGLPDLALLDTNLGGEKSYALAERLVSEGVPVVFCTGYEELEGLPERLLTCPVVSKPFRDSVLLETIKSAGRRADA